MSNNIWKVNKNWVFNEGFSFDPVQLIEILHRGVEDIEITGNYQ